MIVIVSGIPVMERDRQQIAGYHFSFHSSSGEDYHNLSL